MQAWTAELARELPAGAEIFDAHVHLGHDIDGFRGDYDELERIQARFGISRAFMFCLDEPDRRVPILIHGGRGLPPIADHLARLVERYPEAQLIIAHAGIADLAALAARFGGKAGVFFDTSVWSPVDLLDSYHQFSPEQVLYASDYPYGQQPSSLLIALRAAKVAGFEDPPLRLMLAGRANRIADGGQ